jgi:hypothetical protein
MVPGNRAVRDARTTEKSLRDLKPRDSEKKALWRLSRTSSSQRPDKSRTCRRKLGHPEHKTVVISIC